jgi:hypothetical protein
MSTCVPTHALLSALVRRVVVDGVVPPRSDFAAVMALGITRAELLAAFAPHVTAAADEARATILELSDGATGR